MLGNIKNKARYIFIFAALITWSLLIYSKLFQVFYQQDEWMTLGQIQADGMNIYVSQFSLLDLLSGSGRIFSMIFQYPFYKYFSLEIWPFATFSLLNHAINSLLVFIFAYQITKKRLFAFIASIFFICCSTSSQAVIWFAANTTTLPSASFFLLSLILAIKGRSQNKCSLYLLSQLCAIMSFFFKESGIVAFLFIPLLFFQRSKRIITVKQKFTLSLPIIIYGLFLLAIRAKNIVVPASLQNSSFSASTVTLWQKTIIHTIIYPIVSISQVFVPQKIMVFLAKSFQTINYSHLERFTSSQLGVETIVSDFVSFILSIFIIMVSIFLISNVKKYRNILLLSLGLIISSFLPFIILNKENAYLESRYFYIGSIGGGLLLSSMLYGCYEYIKTRNKRLTIIIVPILTLLTVLLFFKHAQVIQRDLNGAIVESKERIDFIRQMKGIIPKLPEKSVLYMTGNNYGYYGVSELKVPFQQGPGYTFMVLYYTDNVIPNDFIRTYFLWGVREQGYREQDNKGFGYFYDISELKKYIHNNKILPSQIIGLFYDTNTKIIQDISGEVRLMIK